MEDRARWRRVVSIGGGGFGFECCAKCGVLCPMVAEGCAIIPQIGPPTLQTQGVIDRAVAFLCTTRHAYPLSAPAERTRAHAKAASEGSQRSAARLKAAAEAAAASLSHQHHHDGLR